MKCLAAFLGLTLLSPVIFANPKIVYEGTATQVLNKTEHAPGAGASSQKTVTYLKLKLSNGTNKVMQKKLAAKGLKSFTSQHKQLPSSIQLGMKVPVLDQGMHGTCATFALMAGLDALAGTKDTYSELCFLNLGKTLAEGGYAGSGWDGQSLGSLLARVDEFGLVTKTQQRAHGCGGAYEYPAYEEDNSAAMPLNDYHALSVSGDFSELSTWTTLLDFEKWIAKDVDIVEQTKRALYHGDRVLIGTLLPIVHGSVEPLGSFHAAHDTWVLTGPIEHAITHIFMKRDMDDWGGHAMVVTGYDDQATATDENGQIHKGLFTLRNSWGIDVGDQGNFYMSYDYFNLLAFELVELVKVGMFD